ncbi:acyl-CoA dehydrogenase family protein [Streptomyces sp. WG-D5]
MELGSEYVAVREEAVALAASLAPLAAAADELAEPHDGMRKALAASRLPGLVVPAAHGGRQEGVDTLAVTVAREALMGTSAHLDSLFAMQGIGSFALTTGGNAELRARWLPRVASMEGLAALALTEDEAGSDLKTLSTTITQEGDELVVRGAKSWISNAGWADFYCVLGREGDGYSVVLVPADAAGLSTTPTETIMAPHLLGNLTFDSVRIPVSHRLGQPGKGFSLVFATLGTFRVSVAGAAVGLAQAALDEAVRHAKRRHQFGRPLAEIGPVGQLIARSWAELEAARVFTYHAASRAAADPRAALDLSSMAKVVATETAGHVVDRCVQVMGRAGLVRDSVIERCYRAARPMRVYEGATEVVLDSLARQLTRRAQ